MMKSAGEANTINSDARLSAMQRAAADTSAIASDYLTLGADGRGQYMRPANASNCPAEFERRRQQGERVSFSSLTTPEVGS
jgi:hypothetical protein